MSKNIKCIFASLALFWLSPQLNAAIYDLTITADNAYAFGFGDENGVASGGLSSPVVNTLAAEIFGASGPETYTGIDDTIFSHVYIATWADNSTAQGVIAGFSSVDATNLNSAGNWEVFATGDLASNATAALNLTSINNQVGLANSTNGVSGGSLGWVNILGNTPGTVGSLIEDTTDTLYTGVTNPAGFGAAFDNQFHPSASWMTYDNGLSSNPFNYTAAGDGGWLIFRAKIPLEGIPNVVPIPSAVWLFGSGLLGLVGAARRKKS